MTDFPKTIGVCVYVLMMICIHIIKLCVSKIKNELKTRWFKMTMEFELSKALPVMNKEAGEYEDHKIIYVTFKGKKGLKALKSLQDMIFRTFQETAKSSNSQKKEEKDDKEVTADDVLAMLEMTGHSEQVFDAVMDKMKYFATIGTLTLNDHLQEEMEEEDLDELYKKVLKDFLLPKVTRMMNSMNK